MATKSKLPMKNSKKDEKKKLPFSAKDKTAKTAVPTKEEKGKLPIGKASNKSVPPTKDAKVPAKLKDEKKKKATFKKKK